MNNILLRAKKATKAAFRSCSHGLGRFLLSIRAGLKLSARHSNSENAPLMDAIVGIAVEAWRFGKVFDRMLSKLDEKDRGRYESQYQWFTKKVHETLNDAGLRIVDLTGQVFDPGMAASPVNAGDFDKDATLVVDQMIEPLIMDNDGAIIRMGTVSLAQNSKQEETSP